MVAAPMLRAAATSREFVMISRPPTPRTSIQVKSPPSVPSIGLALGGGGARGLAHIVMLEAFDEMGLTPKVISGTSIGAILDRKSVV